MYPGFLHLKTHCETRSVGTEGCMAPADQTYFNGDVVEMVVLHRPNAAIKGIGRCRHEGAMSVCGEGGRDVLCTMSTREWL